MTELVFSDWANVFFSIDSHIVHCVTEFNCVQYKI